jgi:hypothetical protein
LVRRLLIAQEAADSRRAESECAIDLALASPNDDAALHRATEAESLAAEAERHERDAAEHWWAHVLGVNGLIGFSEELYLTNETEPAPAPAGGMQRRTPVARGIRRRGNCPVRPR